LRPVRGRWWSHPGQQKKARERVSPELLWRSFGEYAFLEDSRYTSQRKCATRRNDPALVANSPANLSAVGYRELAEKLRAMGIPETERNIANKISRGGFTAAFFAQCLDALGVNELNLRR
jgi:hypothetical protein